MDKYLWRLVAAAFVVVTGGCGGGDSGDEPKEASATIGAAGGTLDGPDGARVVIPPGALAQATLIGIARSDAGAPVDLPQDYTSRGPLYEFTPHDIVFLRPVTMRVPATVDPKAADSDVFTASPSQGWHAASATVANGFAEWGSSSFSWAGAYACLLPVPDPDPVPGCYHALLSVRVSATPASAATRSSADSGVQVWAVNAATTVRMSARFSAKRDCGDAKITITRHHGPGQPVAVLVDQPVSLSLIPGSSVASEGSFDFDVAMSDADNGSSPFGFVFSCQRAYQPPLGLVFGTLQTRAQARYAVVLVADIAAPPPVPPVVTSQPTSQGVTAPATATFAAAASSTPAAAVQWQVSSDNGVTWTDIAGATATSFTTPATTLADDGKQYRAVFSNSAGPVPSVAATLSVAAAPATPLFSTQPADQSVTAGATATFTVAATGTPAPSLQWQVSSDSGTTWAAIVGANAASYTTPATTTSDNGTRYRAVASNSAGSANSSAALLVVRAIDATALGKVAAAIDYACAVKADTTLACWGANGGGQLGDGTTTRATQPRTVVGLIGVTAVAAGSGSQFDRNRVCVIHSGGALACWGAGTSTPQAMAGVADARSVAVGATHACYVDASGHAWCWGGNIFGELGDGTFDPSRPAPGLVQLNGTALGGVAVIGAGDGFTCALRLDGTAWCWGSDFTGNADPQPHQISGVFGATDLVVGNSHACAIVAAGAVKCWYFAGASQLGDGSTATRLAAVSVTGLSGALRLAAGFSRLGLGVPSTGHTCAVKSDGSVVCWGTAPMGNGSATALQAAPVAVTGLVDAIGVAAGDGTTCVLRATGSLQCWGGNASGQLGVGDTAPHLTPAEVTGGAVFWR